MDTFALTLVLAVPVLYGLFWWLDYRWWSVRQESGGPAAQDVDPDDSW